MKTKFLLALLVALILALSVTPAFAQGGVTGGSFCAGGNRTIESGETTEGLLVLGCNVTVRSGGTLDGDVAVFGGNVTLESGSRVNGDIALFGGNVQVAGLVQGDVAIAGGAGHLASTAVVNGNVRVFGGGLTRDDGAVVRGSVTHENNFRFSPSFGRLVLPRINRLDGFWFPGLDWFGGLLSAIALAALGALLVVFFPEPTGRVVASAQRAFWPSMGAGCLTILVAPVLLLLLLVITLGLGTALLAIALVAAWTFGWIAIGYLVGQRLLEALKAKDIAPALSVIVGVFLLAVVGQVPCLGWLIGLLIGTLGLGAVVLTRFGTRPYPYAPAFATPLPAGPMPPAPTAEQKPELGSGPGGESGSST